MLHRSWALSCRVADAATWECCTRRSPSSVRSTSTVDFAEHVRPSAEQNGGSGTRKIGVFGFTPLKLGKRQSPAIFSHWNATFVPRLGSYSWCVLQANGLAPQKLCSFTVALRGWMLEASGGHWCTLPCPNVTAQLGAPWMQCPFIFVDW